MSQRRKARVRKEDKCCNLCNETYTSKKVKNKLSVCLTKQNQSKKVKATKNLPEKTVSKRNKKSKSTETSHLADTLVCSSSPSLSDKISDSDLIIISEADSNLSEKVSPSSIYSGSSPCNDSIFKLNTNNLSSEVPSKSVSLKSICNISTSSNENTIENNKILPYGSSFAATLPNIEVNYESDFSDLIETGKTQNVMKDKSQQIIPEHCNSLQHIAVPNYLSPKRNFLSMMSNFNSACGFKENVIYNQLKIEPVTKPSDFNYEENNFVDFAVDIAMLRAASNYIKERSKSQNVSVSLPDAGGSAWHNSVVRLSDMLNLSENCLNQFSSEDNESEISISSCKTSDIQPEFFDFTFSENPENISESFSGKNLSDFLNFSSSLTADIDNDLCSISLNKEIADNVGLLNSHNVLSETNSSNVLSETNHSSALSETNIINALSETNSGKVLSETNSGKVLSETRSSNVLSGTNSSNVLSETNSSNVLSETNSSNVLSETNSSNILSETKPKVKRKKKRCIWDTKKRRCKKRTKKKDSPSKLNTENAIPKLNSELNAEAFCDTCDESEAEDDGTRFEFLNQSGFQEKGSSSEIDINHDSNQNIIKVSEESCNQLIKSSDARQFQSTHDEKESPCIIENLYPKKSVKGQALKESEDPPIVTNEECGFNSCEDHCDSFNTLNNCSLSTTASISNQNVNISFKSNKRKRKEDSPSGNQGKSSSDPCETINKCKSPSKIHSPKSKKQKLQKSDFQDIKKLKCSLDLNVLSPSHEISSKSNHSLQNHPESSVPTDESTKTICDVNDAINSNLLCIRVQRLDDSVLQKYHEEKGISEFSSNKSDLKNVLHESSEIISNVCDNFTHEQNSDLISDTSHSEPSHSFTDHTKNTFNLIPDIQENSDMLTENNTLNNTASTGAHIEDCNNIKKITHVANVCSEISVVDYLTTKSCYSSSEQEHLLNKNISELIPKNTNSPSDGNTSIISENISDSELQENEHIINAQSSKSKSSDNTEPIIFGLMEDDLDFEEDQQEDLQNLGTSNGLDQQEDLQNLDTSNELDQQEDLQNLDTNNGLDQQEDRQNLDTNNEFDQQEDLQNLVTNNNTSVSKFYSDQQSNFFGTVSYSVNQDHLSKTDCKMNTVDTNANREENPYSFSRAFQETFPNFHAQDYSSLDDDSDSDSDKDYSYKRSHERRSNLTKEPFKNESLSRNPEENNLLPVTGKHHEPSLSVCDQSDCNLENDMAENSTNPTKVLPEASLHFTDVLVQIEDHCSKKMGIEAVKVAHTYISISSSTNVNKILFKKLLSGLFSFVIDSTDSEVSLSGIFDDVLKLVDKFEIYDKKLLSYFIIKCYEQPKLNSYVKKIFDNCQKKSLPLKSEAINAFISVLKTEELDISVLLDYINYIKSVCKKKIPKILMHSALEMSTTGKSLEQSKNRIYNGMHHMCNILKGTTPKEVNELNLKEFLQTCFKKSMYANIADMFRIWNTKNDLSTCIYLALACESEFMATYYGKLADAIYYDINELCPEQKIMFGQIGIALMLEAFTRKYLDCALEILNILHKYNVNYYELGLSFCKFYLLQSSSDAYTFDVKIQPFLVVFVAVDICLHFQRPKDAFYIFQDFSWVTPNENLDEEVKMYVLKERYHRLIKLVPLLNEKDSLHQGWEALKILLTAVEQDLVEETLEEKNKVSTEEKSENAPDCTEESSETLEASHTKEKTPIQCIREIYNEYLISLINSNELSSAFDLYQHSFGPKKNIFTVKPAVLRGLVVAFSNTGKSEFAKSVFMKGVFADVYSIKKPELSSARWDLTIRSEWTVPEIRFVVEWFISLLSPLLSDKPKETNFEKWFSLTIIFKIKSSLGSKLTCLVEPGLDPKYYINKTKFALQSMSPSLQYTDAIEEEALIVTSDSLYNYWKSKCCVDSPTISKFKKAPLFHQRFSFGEFNPLSEKENSTLFSEKNCLQSPNDLQTNLAEYLVSEYIDEIRSTSSAGTLAPVSPETNPNKMYQNIPNISPVTSFISDKETSFAYKNMQESSKKLSDSIIQVSKPRRSIDMFDKEYEVQRGKDSSFAHNGDNRSGSATNRNKSPSIHSVSKNSNIESKLNVSTASSSTPKLKNKGLMRTISNKRIKKLNTKVIVNNSKVNPNSEKLTNDIDLKKLTVCFAANSSARIVSNSSKNLETISNNPQKSKSLIKKPSVVKTSDTTKNNLNKSNNILNKTTSKISSNNKTATNISSNLLVKVPVSNLNVNEIEQSHKKPVIVSINEVSSEKMTSTVIPQNKNSDTIISNINFTQSKVSEPVIQRTINLKCQDSESTKKISSTVTLQNKGSTIVSHNNSLQCTVVKPIFKRVINSAGHQNKDSDAIMSTKSCINKDMNYQEDKTKVRITPISIQSSHASDSLVSSPQKDQADIKTGKLTQQKIAINKTAASKSFLGNCDPEEFKRIVQFLKIKIALKNKNLLPEQQHKKAFTLAKTFIKINNSITKLDKRTMKMLDEFEKANV